MIRYSFASCIPPAAATFQPLKYGRFHFGLGVFFYSISSIRMTRTKNFNRFSKSSISFRKTRSFNAVIRKLCNISTHASRSLNRLNALDTNCTHNERKLFFHENTFFKSPHEQSNACRDDQF